MIAQHIDTAKEELAKVSTGTVHPATAKLLDSIRDELDKGAKEIASRQKKIRIADRSKFSWATVEAYESDDLADDSADQKRMEKVEREAARHLAKKRSRRGQGSFSRDMYRNESKRRSQAEGWWRP